jgi:hypothetical protein
MTLIVRADIDLATVELAVHGQWDRSLQVESTHVIAKCFAERPVAVVADLGDMYDPSGASAPTWWTAAMRGARLDPVVSVVLCLLPEEPLAKRLARLGARWSLPVYPSLDQARDAIAGGLPMNDRLQLRLPAGAEAASRAWDLLDTACSAWALPALRHRGRLVLSVLVRHATEQAGDVVVTVTRRGSGLHLAVSDNDPRPPALIEPVQEPARLLRDVVRANATTWGSTPTAAGKVVWAYLHPR